MAEFDVERARRDGYSDAEMVTHLAGEAGFDAAKARKDGYSEAELLSYLTAPAPPAAKPEPAPGVNIKSGHLPSWMGGKPLATALPPDAAATPAPQPTVPPSPGLPDEMPNMVGNLGTEEPLKPQPEWHMPTVAEAREALKPPPPGWVPSGILPMATKEVAPGQGDINAGVMWDWGLARTVGNALLKGMEGTGQATSLGGPHAPGAGWVSPDLSQLLFGVMAGNPNPLSKMGALRAGENPIAAAGPFSRGAPLSPAEATAAQARGDAKAVPLSPEFKAAPTAPGYDGPSPSPVQIDVGGGRTIDVPGAKPAEAPSEINRNLPETLREPPPPPSRSADAHLPPASARAPTGPDSQWLTGLRSDIQQVLEENGVNDLSAATTPEAQAKMTPAQMKANRRMAELKEVLSPPAAGEDTVIHVAGSEPTLAERAGDPVISQRETLLRQRNPGEFEPRLTENSEARIRAFEDKSGTEPQLVTLAEDQAKAAQRDTALIMKSAKPADLNPALTYLDDLLNDPRIAERDDVVSVLKPLRDKLFDPDGNLKTNPQAVWGMHDNLMALLEKAKDPLKATGAEKYAFTHLNGFKQAIDAVMNTATDGHFQTFLDNQASFFQQRNGLEVLQKFRTKLVNSKTGHVDANAFHRWVVDLAVRRGKPGVDPAMDIPDTTMRTLMDIDNDLKRSSRIDLGKARGSPTNLYFEVAKAAGLVGAHAIAGLTTGGVGNFIVQQAAPTVANWRLNRLTKQHLAAPPGGFRVNPLWQD